MFGEKFWPKRIGSVKTTAQPIGMERALARAGMLLSATVDGVDAWEPSAERQVVLVFRGLMHRACGVISVVFAPAHPRIVVVCVASNVRPVGH